MLTKIDGNIRHTPSNLKKPTDISVNRPRGIDIKRTNFLSAGFTMNIEGVKL